MPSTFTTNLNLEKQATGENNNTWGTKLNDLIDQLDRAIAGRLPKSVAGAADVALTSAEYEELALDFTGALTGSINVIFPTIEKNWYVRNSTSGSFTLTCKTSAGSGVVIPQGHAAVIFGDGTNIEFFLTTLRLSQIIDNNSNELLRLSSVASAVNEPTIANAATGNAPSMKATGGDANVDLELAGKGTGAVKATSRLQLGHGSDIASASALTLGSDGNIFDVTGTTTITSIASKGVGTVAFLQFDGALVLTHHATDLILLGGANITTAAGDIAIFEEYATGDWRMLHYARADRAPSYGELRTVTQFTASGTWTRPSGCKTVQIFVQGGGGGGGGAADGTGAGAGAGGGGGGTEVALLDVSTIATSTITVGTGGAGGAAGDNAGSAGNDSVWSDGTNTVTGSGGAGGGGMTGTGGSGAANGAAGGGGSGGDFTINGDDGGHGRVVSGVAVGHNNGGGSHFSGMQSALFNSTGPAGNGFGGGGAGANTTTTTDIAGGAGADGIVVVWEYY